MSEVSQLQHVRRTTPMGVRVLLLDTGSILGPQEVAMLQALQSRSNKGIEEHLEILAQKGPQKFMATYYVQYGHKSIGDCGSITLFIEGGTMLVAKALQDWELYNGQEGSTRYMDFQNQPFRNILDWELGELILSGWRTFYSFATPLIEEDLIRRYPRNEGEDEKTYEKAIKARAFDIVRGFLPAGAQTNFSWHTTLRQAADLLMRLRHHPLEEVRQVADAIEEALIEKYSSSFGQKRYEETEAFNREWMRNWYLQWSTDGKHYPDFRCNLGQFKRHLLSGYKNLLLNRPAKTEIPKELAECGNMQSDFMLDFASFRDIQRHRAVHQRMPLLTDRFGFEPWYLGELPEVVAKKALTLLEEQKVRIQLMRSTWAEENLLQYYQPMGYKIPNRITGSLPSWVYLIELRGTRFVHPTLRQRALKQGEFLKEELGHTGLRLHIDPDPDRFDIRRGQHDIVVKD